MSVPGPIGSGSGGGGLPVTGYPWLTMGLAGGGLFAFGLVLLIVAGRRARAREAGRG